MSLSLFMIGVNVLFAQPDVIDLPKEEQKKMEFSGVFKSSLGIESGGGSGYIGLAYDHLLSARWRIGASAGYPSVGANIKCFPFGVQRDRLLFSIGARGNFYFDLSQVQRFSGISVPLGISYFIPSRINLELEVGPIAYFSNGENEFTPLYNGALQNVWFSVKIARRFSFYSMRRARQLENE